MMTPARVNQWNRAIEDAGVVPTLSLVDLHHLTQGARVRAYRSAPCA